MNRVPFLPLLWCVLVGVAAAQQAPRAHVPTPLTITLDSTTPANVDTPPEPGSPPQELLDERVHRLLDDFNQRHDQRVLEIYSYGKASDADPAVKQFADPRKVGVELKDEQDREQTSRVLAAEYGKEAHRVEGQEQSLQAFIAKRQKILDDLSKRGAISNRQDLEVAAENLARQPGTDAQVREIRRRLAEGDRDARELAIQQPLAQQEASSAQDELRRLQALEQSLSGESKSYLADAASARANQLRLADRLEFYAVNAQAEDVLDQGRKATEAVHHLAASPEVQDTLESLGPGKKAEPKSDTAKECTQAESDAKACAGKATADAKE
jgi:hypothetical protein